MTPKEKAQQLFGKYAMYLRANLMYDEEANEDAKHCALMAVDEIINELIGHEFSRNAIVFWASVKQEIEKL
jgi:hypothetical protein